ncbi:serine/threonine-protein kinase [Aporhodopirellula aestuarii]|uniref:Serine/threonine protein kinase n=1 Tax=Aporhodopirellula aestuarii TaxID=2950107 RepID=A0ABT0U9L6_9BACT|nr:serine/threonine-protein kinase [Aporhodopirellula aestuarii]MCM2373225.1 serine/threonine protein kinase [Aporhodopirellula aestuarii]
MSIDSSNQSSPEQTRAIGPLTGNPSKEPVSGSIDGSPESASPESSSDSKRSRRRIRSGVRGSKRSRARGASSNDELRVSRSNSPATAPNGGASRYQILGELGRGGWGVVQSAIDKHLKRPVAIKRISGATRPSNNVRDRFLHEAVVTSQLQHPGIVPVHELSEDETGNAYYVMKLLDGQPFHHLIRQTHTAMGAAYHTAAVSSGVPETGASKAGTSKRDVSDETVSERRWLIRAKRPRPQRLAEAVLPLLERFIDICNAVAYAHEQGVLHRDLKPANVMIGGFGETIIVDWGLAKRLHEETPIRNESVVETELDAATRWIEDAEGDTDSARTSAGSIIGTPAYMPPEQALGNVDGLTPASDIYSLGVILYEILVGHHPFKGSNIETALRRVRTGDWVSAKQVRRDVPRALSAICERAMSHDPRDRYASAESLADDVRRYIAGEAVQADRENWMDRIGRWCRRHRTAAISFAGTSLVLLVASSFFSYFIHQAHNQERAARVATEAAHKESLELLGESRVAADAWLIDLSGSLEFYPGLLPIRNQLIEQATEHYEDLLKREQNGPSPWSDENASEVLRWRRGVERSKLHLRLGDLYRLRQSYDVARKHYENAENVLASLQTLADPDRDSSEEVALQSANVAIGKRLIDAAIDDQEPALKNVMSFEPYERRVEALLATYGVTDPNEPSTQELPRRAYELASCMSRMNLVSGRTPSADMDSSMVIAYFERASDWAEWLRLSRGKPSDHRLAVTTTTDWATAMQNVGRHAEAIDVWQQLVANLEKQIELVPDRIDYQQSLAHARLQLANALTRTRNLDQARSEYIHVIEELNHAWSLSDSDGFYRINLSAAESNLGMLLAKGTDEERELAVAHLTNSLRTLRRLIQEDPNSDGIRRFCETSHTLATAQSSLAGVDAMPALVDANVGYEILTDYGMLLPGDAQRWTRVLAELANEYDRRGATQQAIDARNKIEQLKSVGPSKSS